jgi:hypothetical protein
MRLLCRGGDPAGTNRGDKEAEENRESKNKFVANGERRFLMPAPLEVGRDGKDDEEDSVEERFEREANYNCLRVGDHLQRPRGGRNKSTWVGGLYNCRVPGSNGEPLYSLRIRPD